MEKLKILAPAKINLILEITGKRQDGFHNICSLVEKINLFDEIEISYDDENCVMFTGEWEIPRQNTITKLIETLTKLFPDRTKDKFLRITVHKKIPPGSGLGGASSDAAAVLKACNFIWDLELNEKELLKIAASIGSDVPLFLCDSTCIIEGRGEIVYPVENMPVINFLLFVPDFQISTKNIYQKVSCRQFVDLTSARSRIKIFLDLWRNFEIEKMQKALYNRLEEVVLAAFPDLAKALETLEKTSGKRFVLTGSGGGVYAIEKSQEVRFEVPQVVRNWLFFKTGSFRTTMEKEEQHGNN